MQPPQFYTYEISEILDPPLGVKHKSEPAEEVLKGNPE